MVEKKKKLRRWLYVIAIVFGVLYFSKHIYRGVFDSRYQKESFVAAVDGDELVLKDGTLVKLTKGSHFFYAKTFHELYRKAEIIGSGEIKVAQG